MKNAKHVLVISVGFHFVSTVFAQQKGNDVTAPLHAMKPDYPFLYQAPKVADVKIVLNRVYHYLDSVTPTGFINEKTNEPLTDYTKIDANTILSRGDFRIVSYQKLKPYFQFHLLL